MVDLKAVLTDMAKSIVDNPDRVEVSESRDQNDNIILVLNVAPEDMGMVIGRHGKIAKAIRTVIKAAANSLKVKVTVEIK